MLPPAQQPTGFNARHTFPRLPTWAQRTEQPGAAVRVRCGPPGYGARMRWGNVEIRPLGGGPGCLLMILGSILLSLILTIGLNLIFR
jgi:hypothetical protein